ncbi:MAG: extracellular solute-binding protein, partial [Clostridiales bacterium]|nr:extracellular solute-binding protein [Clostridiales bacterium]
KLLCVFLAVTLVAGGASVFAGCTKRSEQLKLYSQGEYMDEEIFSEFESWYKEQTGEKVKVSMSDFQSNEDMYTIVSKDHADYDLICPSDYMVEKMIKEGLVQKVDKERLDIAAEGLFMPEYIEATRAFDPTLEYSVPYMFGTFGILYNRDSLGKTVTSWAELFGGNTDKRISLKKSPRDTYHAASLYLARDTLATAADKKAAVQAVFDDVSDGNVSAVRSLLSSWKSSRTFWDDEDGKFNMAQNKLDMGLYWSCDAGYVMSDYEDDSGNISKGNKSLWYVIPEEGGNVYLDSFVISKYAKNTKAANYFLQFLCEKAAAVANSEYCGAISPVRSAYEQLKTEYEAMDLTSEGSVFKGTSEEWKRMYIDMLFPPADVLARCGQMRDYGSSESKVVQAMADVMQ